MKAQQAIAIVKEVTANAPHLLKALGYGVFGVIFFDRSSTVSGILFWDDQVLERLRGRFLVADVKM